MHLTKLIKLPDFVTLLNAAMGLLSVFCSLRGLYHTAAYLILAAVLFDYLDGKIARFSKKANDFGRELDSLADITSFGVAPAALGFALITGVHAYVVASVLTLYVSCGILRLARYNITHMEGFEGMPITINGILLPLFVLLNLHEWLLYYYALSAAFMVSTIKVKKLL
ncbi:MAG: CDP-diacylglycerol--serine O-phosphatidyltransferase [archaeon]